MRRRKYFLDLEDVQYKQVKISYKMKFYRLLLWFSCTITITFLYSSIFHNFFGSPKEGLLIQKLDNLKLKYALVEKDIARATEVINGLRMSDEVRYRPVLGMDSIPGSIRKPGFGGVDRFRDLNGYIYTDMMKSVRNRIEEMRNMVSVQEESFKSITEQSSEWKRMFDYLPMICPVSVVYKRGDGLKFREVHPVLGTPQWHHGQDFNTPYGTEVYATGAGRVIEAGWNSGGFGNCIVIDHGYGYQTTYGHLSNIKVSLGMNVKRGDMIGLSGSSGISSGPHLHYQIDLYGQHRNPLYYFNDDLSEDEYLDMIQLLTSSTKFR